MFVAVFVVWCTHRTTKHRAFGNVPSLRRPGLLWEGSRQVEQDGAHEEAGKVGRTTERRSTTKCLCLPGKERASSTGSPGLDPVIPIFPQVLVPSTGILTEVCKVGWITSCMSSSPRRRMQQSLYRSRANSAPGSTCS